jgi:hypothetical protein
MNWIALCPKRHFTKMRVAFFEDERLAISLEEFGIAFKHRSCSASGINSESVFALGEDRARHKPHKVHRVGHASGLIEIIDAPDQPPFFVAPSAKIFHMQVPNRQHSRSLDEIGACLPPERTPPVECRAQESEERARHLAVFKLKIRLHNIDLTAEPILIVKGGGDDRCKTRHGCLLLSGPPLMRSLSLRPVAINRCSAAAIATFRRL